jgi:SOS-response transcriptional repressor LexA
MTQPSTDDLIVDMITRQHRSDGHPPTAAEIAAAVGRSETAVRRRLTRLREEGRVNWDDGRHRSLRTTNMKIETEPM